MAKIVKQHECDTCDEKTYFVRLAEPQPVRVEGPKPFAALAEHALVHINQYRDAQAGKTYDQVSVMVADQDGKEYPGLMYAYNRARTLAEVMWTLGGEYNDDVDVSATAADI